MDTKTSTPANNQKVKLDPNLQLSITIKKPEQTVFDGLAFALTSYSNKGKFDVLPYHANFIALIKEEIVIHVKDQKPQIIPLESGVMKVTNNKVHVILGVETKKGK
jgi:F0F1-type ATP synthase epsilon subunit